MTKNITSADVSIVIQGQLFNSAHSSTLDVVKSAQKFYPKSEIILSTWIGSEIDEETKAICDHIVLSDDPGDQTVGKPPININRQLVSTKNGLKLASRPYVIKTRTDVIFTSDSLLSFMSLKLERDPKHSVGKQHICVADFSTRTHLAEWRVPFWVCDFIYAGYREDIQKLFAVELYSQTLFEYYLHNPKPEYMHRQKDCFRYTPESYLTYNYLSVNKAVSFENSFDNNPETVEQYEKLLVNNLVVLGTKQLGVDSLKYYLPLISTRKRLTYSKWSKVYQKYHSSSLPRPRFGEDSLDYISYKLNKATKKKLK